MTGERIPTFVTRPYSSLELLREEQDMIRAELERIVGRTNPAGAADLRDRLSAQLRDVAADIRRLEARA